LPAAHTPENTPALRQLAIDVSELKPQNEIQFKVSGSDHAGYLLATASLVLELGQSK
jgi:hypothetical protein